MAVRRPPRPVDLAAVRQQARAEFDALRIDALEQRACDDFYTFVKVTWGVVEPSQPYIDNWHVKTICREIQDVLTNGGDLVISVPPGYAKSLITSVFLPPFAWLQDPGDRMLYLAGSESLANRDAEKSRKIAQSPIFGRLIARKILALRGAQKRTGELPTNAYRRIILSDNPQPWGLSRSHTAIESHGTELGGHRWAFAYGAHITGERGRILVVDDPVDAKAVVLMSSARQVEVFADCVRVFDQVLESRTSAVRPVRIVIAQRLHEQDLPGVLITRRGQGWRTVVIPEEFDPDRLDIHPDDPRTTAGELAYPGLYGPERVARRKRSWGQRQYAAQGNQDPRPATGGMLEGGLAVGRQKRYVDNPHTLAMASGWRLLIVIDSTFGAKSATASFVSIQAWQVKGATKRFLYQRRGRWALAETAREIEHVAKVFPTYQRCVIEAKANGRDLIEILAGRIRGLEGQDPLVSKEGRAGVLAIEMEAGDVEWPHPDNGWIERVQVEYREIASIAGDAARRGERWAVDALAAGGGDVLVPWIVLWEDELGRFPGDRDDQVDASSMAVIHASSWQEDALTRATRLADRMRVPAIEDLFRRV